MSQSPAPTDASSPLAHPHRYTAALANDIEPRWQEAWEKAQAFRARNPGEPGFDPAQPKFYCLDMFPYPSGAGLHVGHPEGYTATDIVSRYRRMCGANVLHPMGWDAFGLPAEQYAVQTGVHPAITTERAIETFRRQLKRFGFSYDWSREVNTTDPNYYHWTQWIWLQAYHAWYDHDAGRARPVSELINELENGRAYIGPSGELRRPGVSGSTEALGGEPVGLRKWHELSPEERRAFLDDQRLAYLGEQTVNWCPRLGTVLANEEVIDGRSERGGFPVRRLPLRQWMFRITAYAERLLNDLDLIRWPDSTRTMQTEWIGRSEGADIDFDLEGRDNYPTLRVFTTRPDTIFGATYMVVAPEHDLVDDVLANPPAGFDTAELSQYVDAARRRADVDRLADTGEKTGVFTGVYALNPATRERIAVWTADYVLAGYGHGAIMAVPAHDQRDYDFAVRFDLPVRDVVYTPDLAALKAFVERAGDDAFTSPALPAMIDAFVAARLEGADDGDAYARAASSSGSGSFPGGATARLEAAIGSPIGMIISAIRARGVVRLSGRADATPGIAVNSARGGEEGVSIDGCPTAHAKRDIISWLEQTGIGHHRVNYKLRDWLFSRQRYWGEPFPIVFDADGNHYPISEAALPVHLPELADYTPIESDAPVPPLSKATSWVRTTAGEAGVDPTVLAPETPVTRETNTMPGWAGSCWYYLRYCDPHNGERFVGEHAERYWLVSERADGTPHAGGVDLYVGGAEHAVLHLLYARFWHKMLYDLGYVSTVEPVGRLFHQGLILSHAYQRDDRSLVPIDEVEERGAGVFVEKVNGQPVTQVMAKMSKSLRNVINPDDVIAEYGADTFRLYEMYMGPLEAGKPWNTRDIVGPFRFLQRFWRMCIDEETGAVRLSTDAVESVERLLHRTIARVEEDIDRFAFNTAIAAMIEFVNHVSAGGASLSRDQASRIVRVLSPFAPHMAEEIWSRLGEPGLVAMAEWPEVDPALLIDDTIELPVQVNGKLRARITVATDADEAAIEAAARAEPRVAEQLAGATVRKVVVIPGRMVSFVVG